MSRSTQFLGLNQSALKWIDKYCIHNTIETLETIKDENGMIVDTKSTITRIPCTKIIPRGKVLGMFGETVYNLKEYTTRSGLKVQEFVQADPWSSGPVIFLALKFVKSGDLIKKSLYSNDEINNC